MRWERTSQGTQFGLGWQRALFPQPEAPPAQALWLLQAMPQNHKLASILSWKRRKKRQMRKVSSSAFDLYLFWTSRIPSWPDSLEQLVSKLNRNGNPHPVGLVKNWSKLIWNLTLSCCFFWQYFKRHLYENSQVLSIPAGPAPTAHLRYPMLGREYDDIS